MASHKYQLSNIRNIAKVVNTSSMLLELLENLRRTFLMFGWTVSKYTVILQIQHQRHHNHHIHHNHHDDNGHLDTPKAIWMASHW